MRLLSFIALAVLALASCNTVRGSLHDKPSRGSDLPFEVGVYVRDSLGGVPTYSEALIFRDNGTVLSLREADDLGSIVDSDGFRAHEGTYFVVSGGVELRLLAPVPNVGGGRYVRTDLAVPISASSFQVNVSLRVRDGARNVCSHLRPPPVGLSDFRVGRVNSPLQADVGRQRSCVDRTSAPP